MVTFGAILKYGTFTFKTSVDSFWPAIWKLGPLLIPTSGHTANRTLGIFQDSVWAVWPTSLVHLFTVGHKVSVSSGKSAEEEASLDERLDQEMQVDYNFFIFKNGLFFPCFRLFNTVNSKQMVDKSLWRLDSNHNRSTNWATTTARWLPTMLQPDSRHQCGKSIWPVIGIILAANCNEILGGSIRKCWLNRFLHPRIGPSWQCLFDQLMKRSQA